MTTNRLDHNSARLISTREHGDLLVVDMTEYPVHQAEEEYGNHWDRLIWTMRITAHNWFHDQYPDHSHRICEGFNHGHPIVRNGGWEVHIRDDQARTWALRFGALPRRAPFGL